MDISFSSLISVVNFHRIINMGNKSSTPTSSSSPPRYLTHDLSHLDPNDFQALVSDCIKDDPVKGAKFTLVNNTVIGNSLVKITKQDIALVVQDCYSDICKQKVNEAYIMVVIEGIVRYMDENATKGEDVKEGVEQLLRLAARTIKGEDCNECGEEYESMSAVSDELHVHVVQAIQQLEHIGQERDYQWSLGDKPKYSLDKLSSEYFPYHQLLHLGTANDLYPNRVQQFEEMWCHKPREADSTVGRYQYDTCTCWDREDGSEELGHVKYCPDYEF
jgi:hypothetical protein